MAQMCDVKINKLLRNNGYEQVRKIGEGAFGKALLVQSLTGSSRAVVKMVDISRASKRERDEALQESRLLSALKHPSIVEYQESFLEDGWIGILMDHCAGGDLSNYIKKAQRGGGIAERQVVIWLTEAVLGLKYIHERHVLHRDLKTSNLFLTKDGNLKIGDFGIAKVMECTVACAQTQIGTPYYLCPEICQGKSYAWGSDIWALGCILFEMCAGRVPFQGHDLRSLLNQITKAPIPDIPQRFSSDLKDILKLMLNRNPSDRPMAQDLLEMQPIQERARKIADRAERDAPPQVCPAESRRKDSQESRFLRRGDVVEYYSETHKEWVESEVIDSDSAGSVILNVKPNTWLTPDVQATKVRLPPKYDAHKPVLSRESKERRESVPKSRSSCATPASPEQPVLGRKSSASRLVRPSMASAHPRNLDRPSVGNIIPRQERHSDRECAVLQRPGKAPIAAPARSSVESPARACTPASARGGAEPPKVQPHRVGLGAFCAPARRPTYTPLVAVC